MYIILSNQTSVENLEYPNLIIHNPTILNKEYHSLHIYITMGKIVLFSEEVIFAEKPISCDSIGLAEEMGRLERAQSFLLKHQHVLL